MALAIRNSSPSKAEIELGKAVSNFESILTREQSAAFQMTKAHALGSPPNVRDVMNLTAEIDLKARQQKGGFHKCFGPRFTMVLDSIQQYIALGDIIVGGSQNLIACGAWSVVRITLLSVVKFSTYLERTSQLFMRVGLSAPRYHEMASLFPQSKTLQELTAQYFVTVVQICHDVVKLCQASFIGQVKAFIQDRNIAEYESQVTNNTNAINEQLRLEEMKKASAAYSIIQSLSISGTRHRTLQSHVRLLDQCSIYPYRAAWKRIRKQGNATWAYEQTSYKEWLDQHASSSLLLRGKLGSGKSVQLASIVDDLNLNHSNFKTAYFFCCEEDSRALEHDTILGCLARQLLEQLPLERSTELSAACKGKFNIETILTSALKHCGKTVFIVDGIDACNRDERVPLLGTLSRLQDISRVKICVSFKLEASNEVESDVEVLYSRASLTLPLDRPELSAFIEAQLVSKLQDGSLVIGDPGIILEVKDAIQAGAKGMFLWARLLIESICFEKTDYDIRKALRNLPRDLPEIFAGILDQCRNQAPDFQPQILKILVAARRPLSLDEFGEAISLTPGDTELSLHRLVNDVSNVLRCCGSLVILDEEQQTLHLIHPSVRQFLLGGLQGQETVSFSIDDAEKELGHRIVTYLSWEGFNGPLSKIAPTFSADGIPKKIVNSSLRDTSKVRRHIAIKLLRVQNIKNMDIGKVLSAEVDQLRNTAISQFHFLDYSRKYWLHHTNQINKSPRRFFSLFSKLVHKSDLVEQGIRSDNVSAKATGKIAWALYHSHSALLFELTSNTHKTQDVNEWVSAIHELKPCGLLEESVWYRLLSYIMQGYRGENGEKAAFADFIQMYPENSVDCKSILDKLSENAYTLRAYVGVVAGMKGQDSRIYEPNVDAGVYNLCSQLVHSFPQDANAPRDLLLLVKDMPDESYNELLKLLLQNPAQLEACKHRIASLLELNNRKPLLDADVYVGFLESFNRIDYKSDRRLLETILRLCPDSNTAYDRVLRTLEHFPTKSEYFIAVLCRIIPSPSMEPALYIKLAGLYISSCHPPKAPHYYTRLRGLAKLRLIGRPYAWDVFEDLLSLRPTKIDSEPSLLRDEQDQVSRAYLSNSASKPLLSQGYGK
ncbi:hypothetical protein GGR52DRAFT_536342 [Hypoxylon sp. FL1284]|nr:hypothetical protein GGR52DRAFT_536342 [Hypoxylon sp. FL1284]